jgi:signal transduction histidine kinase
MIYPKDRPMNPLGDLYRWLAGGPDGYMNLVHCMNDDTFWISLTVLLDLAVAFGYVLIAHHWWQNEKALPKCQAKVALGQMKRIFLFCGTCGYLFIPIKMFWPAWRLYDFVMIGLVFFTWRYALNARQLRVVYHELGRSKQLAYELEESKAESKRKSFFLNAISHDLRTPLNGLMLQAELAEMSASGGDVESLRDSLREIKACARTTADLLASFLELGRLDWSDDSSREIRFDLAELIAQLASAARPLADMKDVEIRAEPPSGIYLVTDRLKLERILQNLLGNGVKFTERGRVEVIVKPSGRDLTIEVSDTGVGIPEAQLETIFDEFYQVNNSERDRGKGFGLGLSIARRLAHQLRGELAVESEVGRGSRFSVILRGVVDAAGNTTAGAELPGPSRGKPKTAALG